MKCENLYMATVRSPITKLYCPFTAQCANERIRYLVWQGQFRAGLCITSFEDAGGPILAIECLAS